MQNNREKFVSILNSLEAQQTYDCQYNQKLIELHGEDSNPSFYNNDLLYKELILVLSDIVPMETEKADEEISRYIYDLNFGRHPDSDVKSHNDLYDLLNVGKLLEDAKNEFESKTSPLHHLMYKIRSWSIMWDNYTSSQTKTKSFGDLKIELEEKFLVFEKPQKNIQKK